ncbi:MAG: 4Fe-4S binding protein [Spirochaetaceae bacterium]|nr:4Fe-4S binding protein [Spirochaetaceae bacterium]
MLKLINFLFFAPAKQGEKTVKVLCKDDKCTFCGKCQKVCPQNAIMVDDRTRIYYSYRCKRCGSCIKTCPAGALEFTKGL